MDLLREQLRRGRAEALEMLAVEGARLAAMREAERAADPESLPGAPS